MRMAQRARQATPRAERTRASILEVAEVIFAEKGFDGTRLEDVAQAVKIRRASIVYYFKDKSATFCVEVIEFKNLSHEDPVTKWRLEDADPELKVFLDSIKRHPDWD